MAINGAIQVISSYKTELRGNKIFNGRSGNSVEFLQGGGDKPKGESGDEFNFSSYNR